MYLSFIGKTYSSPKVPAWSVSPPPYMTHKLTSRISMNLQVINFYSNASISMRRVLFTLTFIAVTLTQAQTNTNYLTLEKCFDMIKSNPQVVRQRYVSETNQLTVTQLGANRLPIVNANASQNVNFGRSIDPFTNQFVQTQILSNNFSLNSSLVLFNGFQNNWLMAQGHYAVLANDYATEKLVNDLATNAANVYFEVLMNQEQLRALETQIANTKTQLEKTQKLVDNGTSIEANLLQLEAQQYSEHNTILNLKNRINVAKNNLCAILNIPYDSTVTLRMEPTELRNNAADIPLQSDQFPQIKESNARIQMAYYAYRAAQGSRMPRLVLNAGITTVYSNQNRENYGDASLQYSLLGYVNNDVSNPVFMPIPRYERRVVGFGKQLDQNLSQYINLQLQIPILNNRIISTNIKKAAIAQKSSDLTKVVAQRQLEADFNQVKLNYQNSLSKFQNATKQLDLNKKYYGVMEKRYNAGISDLYVMLLEKNKVINTEIEQLRLKYEALFYEKMLDFYGKGGF